MDNLNLHDSIEQTNRSIGSDSLQPTFRHIPKDVSNSALHSSRKHDLDPGPLINFATGSALNTVSADVISEEPEVSVQPPLKSEVTAPGGRATSEMRESAGSALRNEIEERKKTINNLMKMKLKLRGNK